MEAVSSENVFLTIVVLLVLNLLHVLLISPLRHIPGPFFWKFTNAGRLLSVVGGHTEKQQRQLHDQLGSAVRLGPNMISISDPTMIHEIYSREEVLIKVS